MTVYMFLGKALEIIRKEPDYRKWGPLIDALKPEEQAEVRPWLRHQARIAQRRQRDMSGTQTRPSIAPFIRK